MLASHVGQEINISGYPHSVVGNTVGMMAVVGSPVGLVVVVGDKEDEDLVGDMVVGWLVGGQNDVRLPLVAVGLCVGVVVGGDVVLGLVDDGLCVGALVVGDKVVGFVFVGKGFRGWICSSGKFLFC